MYPEIKTLLYEAEAHYLQPKEIETFRYHISSIAQRLKVYEVLRDQEIAIFQPIADQLLTVFPQEQQATLERALKHWLSVLRYCAMAMLLNDQNLLQQRLLEWLGDLVKAHRMQAIETTLYELLQTHLKQLLSDQQLVLLQPFLDRAEATLLTAEDLVRLPA